MGRSSLTAALDPALPGRLAELLAADGQGALPAALELIVTELELERAAVHAPGDPDVVRDDSSLELPLQVGGQPVGFLRVAGANPSQGPVLQAVAAVLGLGLARGDRTDRDGGVGAALVAAADGEADEAADRLHDGPVQALVVAFYAAEAATRGADPALARDAVQAALIALRRSLWHLRPRGAPEGDLGTALGALSERLVEAGQLPLGLLLDRTAAAALPAAVLSTVFRLVQACALPLGGRPVRVVLRREGHAAVVEIEGGSPLGAPQRWAAKAGALGGQLSFAPHRLRLVVPVLAPVPPPRTKATS